jgi:hypothetical protein
MTSVSSRQKFSEAMREPSTNKLYPIKAPQEQVWKEEVHHRNDSEKRGKKNRKTGKGRNCVIKRIPNDVKTTTVR